MRQKGKKKALHHSVGAAPFALSLMVTLGVTLTAFLRPEEALARLAVDTPGSSPLLPGELRLFFPRCGAIAAPAVLFRLKRSGYSRCLAQSSSGGLSVTCRR